MNPIVEEINSNPVLRKRLVVAFREDGRPLSSQAIHGWKKLAKGVPADRVATVAREMGREYHELRAEIFPVPSTKDDRSAALSL